MPCCIFFSFLAKNYIQVLHFKRKYFNTFFKQQYLSSDVSFRKDNKMSKAED